jgi:hypothetical protein
MSNQTKEKRKYSDKKEPETYDAATGSVDPTPRRIDLSTLRDIRLEMAAVYRRMNSGAIETAEGSKLVYVLRQIGDIIEMSDIERRIEAIEDRQALISNGRGLLPRASVT